MMINRAFGKLQVQFFTVILSIELMEVVLVMVGYAVVFYVYIDRLTSLKYSIKLVILNRCTVVSNSCREFQTDNS